MGIYGFSSSDDDAEYTPPNDDQEVDKDGDRYVRKWDEYFMNRS